MSAHRPRGAGSVFRRKDGRWVVSVPLPTGADGKRRRRTLYAKDERDAHQQLAQALAAVAGGDTSQTGRQTLGQFLEHWLATVVQPRLSVQTYENYRATIRGRIIRHIGARPLRRLSPQDVQGLYAALITEQYAVNTVLLTHRTLRQALDQAVTWNLIPRNPTRQTKPPRAERVQRDALSWETARKLLAALKDEPEGPLWLLALTSGLRLGELLGLRWADVDLEARVLTVRQQVQPYTGRGVLPKAPKTRAGHRRLEFTAGAADALTRQRQTVRTLRLRVGPAWHEHDLIFPGPTGRPQYPANVRRRWYLILERHGIPRTLPHELRHTNVSELLDLGVSVPEVAARVGHSSAAITLGTYGHFIQRPTGSEAARRLDAALEGGEDS